MTEITDRKTGHWKRFSALLLLAVSLALTATGVTLAVFNQVAGPLQRHNQVYLERSIKDTLHVMVPVGVAKGAIDVVEGTSVNVEAGVVFANAGTNIEVGDTLQPLLDYLDIAWRVLLVNLIYLISAKYLLQGYGPIAQALLLMALTGYFLLSMARCRTSRTGGVWLSLRRISAICLLGAIVFSLVLPLTVFASAQLARTTTDPVRDQLTTTFDDLGEVFDLSAFHDATGLVAKTTAMQSKSNELMRYAVTTSGELAANVARLAVVKILNGVVFPLASLGFLIWLIRSTLIPVLGLGPFRHESVMA